ncbi:MAG: aminoglycoside phosphotransferase family protein [Planctomycetes bacterium]|nr:aminoglycoside phosphotransferase family protein [Planctomycetota bacterium]
MSDPWTRFFEREAQGLSFRKALEALLLELEDADADLLALLQREGRAAWLVALAAREGRALFVGSPLSGTVTALALQGFAVELGADADGREARFAAFRAREQTPGRVRVVAEPGQGYALIVLEDGPPGFPEALSMLEQRLAPEGELVLVVDNRLGYKRSLGRKGEFHVASPLEFARSLFGRDPYPRTLRGWRQLIEGGRVRSVEAFALYPHRLDFSHVVALDEPFPALTIGPMEKKNRAKLAGKALGLFPVLAPSFALVARLGERPAARIERVLGALAEKLGERQPIAEAIVATRGNSAVVHTREGAAWTLHVPLAPKNIPQTERHLRTLGEVRARFPGFPVPEPLFFGTLEGLTFSCERRLPGWTAPQACGDQPRIARMLGQVAELMPKLVVRAPRPFDEADFEAQIAARFRLVIEHAAVPATIAKLERMLTEARAKFLGAQLPLVFYHADLRAKHVQVDAQGNVLGILDWGTAEPEGLPYFDLLHLVVHEVKQEHGLSAGAAWRRLLARELRDYERECLERYCAAVGLAPEVARAIEAIYPVLVAAMAEKNWDYSRPRWLHRQFALA